MNFEAQGNQTFWQDPSGPVLHDTARLSQRYAPTMRYGASGVSTWPMGCDTPSPFSEPSPLENMRSGAAIPPPLPRGYVSDTCPIYPMKTRQNGCKTPLCNTISKGYCAIWGGISHWAARVGISRDFARDIPGAHEKLENKKTVACFRKGKQPKDQCLGKGIPGTSATQTSGYPRQKLYASGLFLLFRQGVAGTSRNLGRDVPDLEKPPPPPPPPPPPKTLCKKTLG